MRAARDHEHRARAGSGTGARSARTTAGVSVTAAPRDRTTAGVGHLPGVRLEDAGVCDVIISGVSALIAAT